MPFGTTSFVKSSVNKLNMWKYTLTLLCLLACLISFGQIRLVESRSYTCQRTIDKIIIDGKGTESTWKHAAWSQYFVDIEGSQKPQPYLKTRVKMAWDKQYFYFFAELEEPHVWAKLTQRDTVIFYDNDFEIFIDPDGDTHNYYEYEVNAFNTVWDLLLTRPYRDGGQPLNAWDIQQLQSAVNINGSINDPTDKDHNWSVEVAIPWKVLGEATKMKAPPMEGDIWRVNFSRVQWETEIKGNTYVKKTDPKTGKKLPEHNWVWSPQREIAMHEPEFWGVVAFSSGTVGTPVDLTPDRKAEEIRQILYHIHRKQIEAWQKTGAFIRDKTDLIDYEIFHEGRPIQWELAVSEWGYHAVMKHPTNKNLRWYIDQTGRLQKK